MFFRDKLQTWVSFYVFNYLTYKFNSNLMFLSTNN